MQQLQYADYEKKNNDISNLLNMSNSSNQTTDKAEKNKPAIKYNKTIKKSPQIAELYNKIHQNSTEESDNLASFKPLNPAENLNETIKDNSAIITDSDTATMSPWNMEEKISNYSENYYKNAVPQYSTSSSNDILLSKLNYVIQLLEDQKDERTNYISEELILYSFLGIFIIFIIDSFSKATKYIR